MGWINMRFLQMNIREIVAAGGQGLDHEEGARGAVWFGNSLVHLRCASFFFVEMAMWSYQPSSDPLNWLKYVEMFWDDEATFNDICI